MDDEAGSGRGAAMARATVQLQCRSPKEARVLWDAVRADDPGSVEGRIDGNVLVITAGPDPMPTLRVTLDDLMACLQVASGTTDAHTEVQGVD